MKGRVRCVGQGTKNFALFCPNYTTFNATATACEKLKCVYYCTTYDYSLTHECSAAIGLPLHIFQSSESELVTQVTSMMH